MKVLWFVNTSSNYGRGRGSAYNGGGWISSLESEMVKREDIELAVSFFLQGQPLKVIENKVTYYPMERPQNRLMHKVKRLLTYDGVATERSSWRVYEERLLRVVNDFQPDIIEVFGSENHFGLVASVTKVPVVLHIQGILTPYLNAFLPPFVSWRSYIFSSLKPKKILKRYRDREAWHCSTIREQEIMRRVNNYIGRTKWDERVTKVYNAAAHYYYGSEILRPVFYEHVTRRIPDKLTIITTISQPLYKGFDVILKTAALLRDVMGIDFEWQCYGNIVPAAVERCTGIRHGDVGVRLMGVASAEKLRDAMVSATAYVHASYIDNSPNSLCEAQMLGLPCIVTDVGGVSSLVCNGKTGFLVPANDPYQIAFLLRQLQENPDIATHIGDAARVEALKRHDRDVIVRDLIDVYNQIISGQ